MSNRHFFEWPNVIFCHSRLTNKNSIRNFFRMNSDGSYSNRYSTTSAPSSGSQSNVTEMSGCSTIDIDIARMFWKSFSLSPPIESKLFSPDIKQRRRTATASGKK